MCGADQPSKKGAERFMERRKFLKTAGLTAAASTTLAAPAIPQSAPPLKCRPTSSFPKSPATTYDGRGAFSGYIAAGPDKQAEIHGTDAGEITHGPEPDNIGSHHT